jgi:hypothetical protein
MLLFFGVSLRLALFAIPRRHTVANSMALSFEFGHAIIKSKTWPANGLGKSVTSAQVLKKFYKPFLRRVRVWNLPRCIQDQVTEMQFWPRDSNVTIGNLHFSL